MLDASQDAAPISNITVSLDNARKSGEFIVVPARFSVGSESVSQTYTVRKTDAGWRVDDGIATWNARRLSEFGSSVNGIPLSSKVVDLYPGTYTVDVGNPNFQIVTLASPLETSEPQTLRVLGAQDAGELDRMVPELTPEAHALGGELVVQAFEKCAAEKTRTSSCGADLTAKDLPDPAAYEGRVHRTIAPETTKLLQFYRASFTPDNPMIQTSPEMGYFDLTVDDPQTPEAKQFKELKVVKFPEVDFTGEKPVVRWVK